MKASILSVLRNLHNDESGQDLVEYALVTALIATGAIATMRTLGTSISTAFTTIETKLTSGMS